MPDLIRGERGATRTIDPEDNRRDRIVFRRIIDRGHDGVRAHLIAGCPPVTLAGDNAANAIDHGDFGFRYETQHLGFDAAIGGHGDGFGVRGPRLFQAVQDLVKVLRAVDEAGLLEVLRRHGRAINEFLHRFRRGAASLGNIL